MNHSAYDMAVHYKKMSEHANHVEKELQISVQNLQQKQKNIVEQLNEELFKLATLYLEELSAEAFQRVSAVAGYRAFLKKSPIVAMEREKEQLAKRIHQIQESSMYIKRKIHLIQYQKEYEEHRGFWLVFNDNCKKFEDLPRFRQLIEHKYDTPEFDLSWWQPLYWTLWSAGDAVCEALGVPDFGDDVLPAYQKEADERAKWQQHMEEAKGKVDAIHQLVQEHDQSTDRLTHIADIYLKNCQTLLQKHLLLADIPLLENWRQQHARDDNALQLALRKVEGLKNKKRFLDLIEREFIEVKIKDIQERKRKYNRKIIKFQRPKNRNKSFGTRDRDQKFANKHRKMIEKQHKLNKLVDRIDAYDDYDRFSLENDPNFWWQEMTGKSPSTITPSLQIWHSRQSRQSIIYDETIQHSHVKESYTNMEHDDIGYLS